MLPYKPMTDTEILNNASEQARLLSLAHETSIYVVKAHARFGHYNVFHPYDILVPIKYNTFDFGHVLAHYYCGEEQ